MQLYVIVLLAALAASATAVSSTAINDDVFYCGGLTTVGQPNFAVNVTISETGTYSIQATFPGGIGSGFCLQQGTYSYNSSSKQYALTSTTAATSNCSSAGTYFEFAFMTSTILSPATFMLNGDYFGTSFTVAATSSMCFARVPVGLYCGSALTVPATLAVTEPYNFQLNIIDPLAPCVVAGLYQLNPAFGSVLYEIGYSNCTEYVVFNNITYAANPPSLTLVGSGYGVGFDTTLTQAKCL